MTNKLNVLVIILLSFSFVYLKDECFEIGIDQERDIKLDSTYLCVYSKSTKDGTLTHGIIASDSVDTLKDKVYFKVTDELQTNAQLDGFTKIGTCTEYNRNGKITFSGSFDIKKDQYGYTKFTGLKPGETVTIHAQYINKAIGVIILIVLLALVVGICILICCCVKKVCC